VCVVVEVSFCGSKQIEAVNHCFKALRSGKLTDVMLDEGLILAVLGHARRMGDLDLAHHAVFALEETKPVYQDFHFLPLLDLLAQKGSYFRLFEIVLLMESMGIQQRLKVLCSNPFYFFILSLFDADGPRCFYPFPFRHSPK